MDIGYTRGATLSDDVVVGDFDREDWTIYNTEDDEGSIIFFDGDIFVCTRGSNKGIVTYKDEGGGLFDAYVSVDL